MTKKTAKDKLDWATIDRRIRVRKSSSWNQAEQKQLESTLAALPDQSAKAEPIGIDQPALGQRSDGQSGDGATKGAGRGSPGVPGSSEGG